MYTFRNVTSDTIILCNNRHTLGCDCCERARDGRPLFRRHRVGFFSVWDKSAREIGRYSQSTTAMLSPVTSVKSFLDLITTILSPACGGNTNVRYGRNTKTVLTAPSYCTSPVRRDSELMTRIDCLDIRCTHDQPGQITLVLFETCRCETRLWRTNYKNTLPPPTSCNATAASVEEEESRRHRPGF